MEFQIEIIDDFAVSAGGGVKKPLEPEIVKALEDARSDGKARRIGPLKGTEKNARTKLAKMRAFVNDPSGMNAGLVAKPTEVDDDAGTYRITFKVRPSVDRAIHTSGGEGACGPEQQVPEQPWRHDEHHAAWLNLLPIGAAEPRPCTVARLRPRWRSPSGDAWPSIFSVQWRTPVDHCL